MTEPRRPGPYDGLIDMIAVRERRITRLYVVLIGSQAALAAYAWSNHDRTMTLVAGLVAALVAVRLWRHLVE